MELANPFTQETRLLYLYCFSCFKCRRSDRGLSLHHITGRDSCSPLNAFLICPHCHVSILHTHEEEHGLFIINYRFLVTEQHYKETPDDMIFLENHPWLFSPAQNGGR